MAKPGYEKQTPWVPQWPLPKGRVHQISSVLAHTQEIGEVDRSHRSGERKSIWLLPHGNQHVQDESMSVTRKGSPFGTTLKSGGQSKRVREEVKELLDQVSRGELDDENEPRIVKRRVREEEMPWFSNTVNLVQRSSCVETCRTLLRFSEDLSGAKALLRIAKRTVHCPTWSAGFCRIPPESAGIHKTCHSNFFSVTQAKLAGPVQCSPPEYAMFRRTPRIRTGLFH